MRAFYFITVQDIRLFGFIIFLIMLSGNFITFLGAAGLSEIKMFT